MFARFRRPRESDLLGRMADTADVGDELHSHRAENALEHGLHLGRVQVAQLTDSQSSGLDGERGRNRTFNLLIKSLTRSDEKRARISCHFSSLRVPIWND